MTDSSWGWRGAVMLVVAGSFACERQDSTPAPAVGGSPAAESSEAQSTAPSPVVPVANSAQLPPSPAPDSFSKNLKRATGGSADDAESRSQLSGSTRRKSAKEMGQTRPSKVRLRRAPRKRSATSLGALNSLVGEEPSSPPDPPAALQKLSRRLAVARAQGATDCKSATARQKAICDLSRQICQMIDRDPNVASLASHCTDSKERCRQAKLRTARRCE